MKWSGILYGTALFGITAMLTICMVNVFCIVLPVSSLVASIEPDTTQALVWYRKIFQVSLILTGTIAVLYWYRAIQRKATSQKEHLIYLIVITVFAQFCAATQTPEYFNSGDGQVLLSVEWNQLKASVASFIAGLVFDTTWWISGDIREAWTKDKEV